MKNLSELGKNISPRKFSKIYNGNKNAERNATDKDKAIVDMVFQQLTYIFSAWAQTWVDVEVISNTKKEWTKAFFENGINSIEQIKMGLEKARCSGTDFLPSPGRFISWCKPDPEDLGYPSTEKAKMLCIAHRAKEKLCIKPLYSTRPIIIELCSLIDWWLIEAATTQRQMKLGDEHFEKKYLDLVNSGYQEPEETSSPRLETSEVTKPRMSEIQEIDRQKRGLSAIAGIRKQLKTKGR